MTDDAWKNHDACPVLLGTLVAVRRLDGDVERASVVPRNPTTGRDSNGVVIMLNMAKPKLGVSAMEVMTAPEAARYIGVHERTLAAMRARGDGPEYTRMYLSGRGVRYQRADLDAWMNARSAAA